MCEVELIDQPEGQEAVCKKCGGDVEWTECWDCGGEGCSYHDCGEDFCACLDPELNVTCSTCNGSGGWHTCPGCDK